MAALWRAATRRKPLHPGGCDADAGTRLARVLTTTDLTALGVGSTLGVGVYVLAGGVARSAAGPAVVLSFLLAAVASVFAGLCYAEFGSRVPRAGSAYVYSYVSIGEFVAFVIGWNLILEYVIGSASVVRGLSMYLDSMMNDTMKHAFQSFAPINVSILSPYFDFFAFATSLLLAVVLAVGVKESSYVNTIFTLLNIAVILFVIIAGSIKADPANWRIRREDIPADVVGGEGGFLPFGVAGVLRGAATCFYGFVGFDCIATTGEEVKKPQRAIPLAIIMSLMIVFLSYFGVSTILTMMVPYYQQDEDAPIPHVFTSVGWPLATWIVSVGGVFGLCASLFGSMFPLPRIIYAMASDGLLFRFLGAVSARLRTPVVATLLAGLLTGLMAGLFELSHLVNMMSIGTLLAYTIVAACVLLLRFTDNDDDEARDGLLITDTDTDNPAAAEGKGHSCAAIAEQLFNIPCARSPTPLTYNIVSVQVFLFCVMSAVTSQSIIQMSDLLAAGSAGAVAAVAVEVVVMLLMVISIALQPRSARASPFRVPFVPFLPALSIFINVYLMMMLDVLTWIRFAVWMAAGVVFYLIYGVWKSDERRAGKLSAEENPPKSAAGCVNAGFVPSETSSDPEATPEVSVKSVKSADDGAATAAAAHSESDHVAAAVTYSAVKENHLGSPQVEKALLGRSEKLGTDVTFVNESQRNVKQNVRVFGGDSIRSYVSVRDGGVKSVKGGGLIVFPCAFVSSECAGLDNNTSEHIPLKNTQSKEESTITVIPGLIGSQNDGLKASEDEKNLYPSIIVLPHGSEKTREEQRINETSDHENSIDSHDSEEYCTPETDELEDSIGTNSLKKNISSHSSEVVKVEQDEKSGEELNLFPREALDVQKIKALDVEENTSLDVEENTSLDVRENKALDLEVNKSLDVQENKTLEVQENKLMDGNSKQNGSDSVNESKESTATVRAEHEPDQGNLRSLSFTEKLNTLLKKKHNNKAKQLQEKYGAKNPAQLTGSSARLEPGHSEPNLHEKLKKKPSVDSRVIEQSLSIKDRLEMLLSQRLVGTATQPDSGLGNKQPATISRSKSHDLAKSVETRETAGREGSARRDSAKDVDGKESPEGEPYTKAELRAKLEDIFSRKERPSFRTRPVVVDPEFRGSGSADAVGKHKLMLEELISTSDQTDDSPSVEGISRTGSLDTSDHSGPPRKAQSRTEDAKDPLEDSDSSEMYFDALTNPESERSESR
ncbi:uncharacterized protein LOC134534106 isoform X2 [Bacillus rossius redtenbacheri]|uniref:uncharacterized protein LOC134534106 isoform X2 n=1 Tax=Bacillus rossius redtenbacheri TaxID=93214 RepID=UPI002FDEF436